MRRSVDDALVDQGGEQVDDVGHARHGFGRLNGEAAGEDAETPEQPLLLVRQELVAPSNRRLESALPRRGVARSLQRDAGAQSLQKLLQRQDAKARRGKLDRKRHALGRRQISVTTGEARSSEPSGWPAFAARSPNSSTASASTDSGCTCSSRSPETRRAPGWSPAQ